MRALQFPPPCQIVPRRITPHTQNTTPTESAATDGVADELMGPERINELMARADYVIVAAALTPATRGMVGAEQFACSKEGQVGGWVCWGWRRDGWVDGFWGL